MALYFLKIFEAVADSRFVTVFKCTEGWVLDFIAV